MRMGCLCAFLPSRLRRGRGWQKGFIHNDRKNHRIFRPQPHLSSYALRADRCRRHLVDQQNPGGCHPGPVRQPGNRLHRLPRPFSPGGRGSGHLPACGQSSGTAPGQGRPGFERLRLFEDKADIYWARTRVLERLNYASSFLPPSARPTLGPDGTGVGHVFWYTIEGKGYDLEQLRTLQDWFVRYQLNTVQGVAEVASIGGFVREYQIDLDPNRLFAYKI